MPYIDSHTHLFLPEFDNDRAAAMQRAADAGVQRMIVPNVDVETIAPMMDFCKSFPLQCFPAMGIHPSSVKKNYLEELKIIEKTLQDSKFIAVGEIGLDFYWDKTFVKEQEHALAIQLEWAKSLELPVIIHTRSAFEEIMHLLKPLQDGRLKGVFHCFSGSIEQAQRIIDMGFLLGIGGVVTFKNSNLPEVVANVDARYILSETDAPYITPHPMRGQRNESSYIPIIVDKIAEIYGMKEETIRNMIWDNADKLFFRNNSDGN